MQLWCQECREWLKVTPEAGEADAHAGSRTRREHRCIGPVIEAFNRIVAAENWTWKVLTGEDRGTTGTTPA